MSHVTTLTMVGSGKEAGSVGDSVIVDARVFMDTV